MELFHFHDPKGNFGDDLNHWIWDSLLPGWRDALPDHVLVGVGTLINDHLPRGRPKIVVGSGIGYGGLPDAQQMAECRFFSVRGPRSAAALGLPEGKGIIDPAIMLPELPEFQGIAKSGPPIFVPHYRSLWRHDWAEVCASAGLDFVSPSGESKEVIRRLAAAPLVIAESMHAAIIADAFGTPWQPAVVAYDFLPSKWMDWADSLGISLPGFPHLEPFSDRLRRSSGRGAGGRPAASAAGEAGTVGSPTTSRSSLRKVIRDSVIRLDRALLPGRLRKLAQGQGTLSDRARLAAARARYRDVLAEVQSEFR